MEVSLHALLVLALDGTEWSASSSGRFTAGKGATDTYSYWRGGWVDPKDCLKLLSGRKTPAPTGNCPDKIQSLHCLSCVTHVIELLLSESN